MLISSALIQCSHKKNNKCLYVTGAFPTRSTPHFSQVSYYDLVMMIYNMFCDFQISLCYSEMLSSTYFCGIVIVSSPASFNSVLTLGIQLLLSEKWVYCIFSKCHHTSSVIFHVVMNWNYIIFPHHLKGQDVSSSKVRAKSSVLCKYLILCIIIY